MCGCGDPFQIQHSGTQTGYMIAIYLAEWQATLIIISVHVALHLEDGTSHVGQPPPSTQAEGREAEGWEGSIAVADGYKQQLCVR